MSIPDFIDSCNSLDLPAGLTEAEAEIYRRAYAAGHAAGYTDRAQHDLVDLYAVADPADAEDRHAVVHQVADRGRAA